MKSMFRILTGRADGGSRARPPIRGTRMKLIGSFALLVAGAVGSFAPVPSMSQSAIEPTPFVLASGLEGPRGLTFGADGNLYVAEAGTGGTNSTAGQCTQVPGPPAGPGPWRGGVSFFKRYPFLP